MEAIGQSVIIVFITQCATYALTHVTCLARGVRCQEFSEFSRHTRAALRASRIGAKLSLAASIARGNVCSACDVGIVTGFAEDASVIL